MNGKLTLPPAVTCALEVASKSEAGAYGMRSVVPALADVEVEDPVPCIERRSYGFLDLKALFFSVRFISIMHVEGDRERSTRLHKWTIMAVMVRIEHMVTIRRDRDCTLRVKTRYLLLNMGKWVGIEVSNCE